MGHGSWEVSTITQSHVTYYILQVIVGNYTLKVKQNEKINSVLKATVSVLISYIPKEETCGISECRSKILVLASRFVYKMSFLR